jgi:hypothetical protein
VHRRVYRTANYERRHSEKDGDQRKTEEILDHPPVVPRTDPELFRRRKDLGICNRSVVFRHNGGGLSLANHCRCRRAERISPAGAGLSSTL